MLRRSLRTDSGAGSVCQKGRSVRAGVRAAGRLQPVPGGVANRALPAPKRPDRPGHMEISALQGKHPEPDPEPETGRLPNRHHWQAAYQPGVCFSVRFQTDPQLEFFPQKTGRLREARRRVYGTGRRTVFPERKLSRSTSAVPPAGEGSAEETAGRRRREAAGLLRHRHSRAASADGGLLQLHEPAGHIDRRSAESARPLRQTQGYPGHLHGRSRRRFAPWQANVVRGRCSGSAYHAMERSRRVCRFSTKRTGHHAGPDADDPKRRQRTPPWRPRWRIADPAARGKRRGVAEVFVHRVPSTLGAQFLSPAHHSRGAVQAHPKPPARHGESRVRIHHEPIFRWATG